MNIKNLESSPDLNVEMVAIINSFNRVSLLSQALPSLLQSLIETNLNSAIIVFDAGSNDGSREFLEDFSNSSQDLPIITIYPSEDIGSSFSAGCNFAVKISGRKFPNLKYCLFFETDNLITNSLAIPLAITLLKQEDKLAAVGFTVERYDGTKTGFGSCFPSPLSFLIGQQLSHILGLTKRPIDQWYSFSGVQWGYCDVVYTSPLLIKYEIWKDTGGMNAIHFPFSDSDTDWCWKVYNRGLRLGVLDITGVIHDNRMTISDWSTNRVIDFHRSRFRLLWTHRGKWIACLKPLLFLRHSLEFLILLFIAFYSERAKRSLQQRFFLLNTVFQGYDRFSL